MILTKANKRKVCRKVLQHWSHILLLVLGRAITLDDLKASKCELCMSLYGCAGCPVSQDVGDVQCRGTPFLRVKLLVRRLRELGEDCAIYGHLPDWRVWGLLLRQVRLEIRMLERVCSAWVEA